MSEIDNMVYSMSDQRLTITGKSHMACMDVIVRTLARGFSKVNLSQAVYFCLFSMGIVPFRMLICDRLHTCDHFNVAVKITASLLVNSYL